MPKFTLSQRLTIAFGGFVFLIGSLILLVAVLLALNIIEMETFLEPSIMKGALIIVGILDMATGFLLLLLKRAY